MRPCRAPVMLLMGFCLGSCRDPSYPLPRQGNARLSLIWAWECVATCRGQGSTQHRYPTSLEHQDLFQYLPINTIHMLTIYGSWIRCEQSGSHSGYLSTIGFGHQARLKRTVCHLFPQADHNALCRINQSSASPQVSTRNPPDCRLQLANAVNTY